MLISLDFETIDFPNVKDATIEVKALDVQSYQRILPLVKDVSGEDMEKRGLEVLSDPKVLKLFEEVLTKFTGELNGIEIKKDGVVKEAELKDLIKIGAMLPNLFMLMMALITMSNLTEDEEKKV